MTNSVFYRGALAMLAVLLAWRTFTELSNVTVPSPSKALPLNSQARQLPFPVSLWHVAPQLPADSAPSNLMTAEFCLSCHMNGRFKTIADHVRAHVRVPVDKSVREQVAQGLDYTAIPDFDLFSDTEPVIINPIHPKLAPLPQLLSSLLSIVRWVVFFSCAIGPLRTYTKVMGSNSEVPAWVNTVQNARWQIMGISFIAFNILHGLLTNSRAFEIFLGTTPIYSAYATGRLPEVSDIIKGLQNAGAILVD